MEFYKVLEQNEKGHLVQVIGVPRSGSTMLERMIANGEDCVQCGELADVFRLKLEWPSHLGNIRPSEYEAHHQLSKNTISRMATDSSKERFWVVRSHLRALSCGMRVSNVLVWKTPVELAFSRWKRGEIGRGRSHWSSVWLRFHRFYLNAGIPFATVKCSDLQNEPAKTLAKVCHWLDIDYFPGKEMFWNSSHVQIGGSPTARSTNDATGIFTSTELPIGFETIRQQAIEFEARKEVMSVTEQLMDRAIPSAAAQPKWNWMQPVLWTCFDHVKRLYDRGKINFNRKK